MRIHEIPRVQLLNSTTALDDAPRLAKEIGISRLLVKRDDVTALALGGNKVRKLEYLMADAQTSGADIILTCGGPQSNHVRMTAAAARKFNMDCMLFMPGCQPETFCGNLTLDAILGAEIRFLPDLSFDELQEEMSAEAERLRDSGRTPYVVPMGGSTPLASLGYVDGVRELAAQLEEIGVESVDIVCAVGTCGTMSGIVLGTSLFLPSARPVGITILLSEIEASTRVKVLISAARRLIGVDDLPPLPKPEIYDGYIGDGYGIPTPECTQAILLAGRTEGLILDPVYTGKAMAGLIDLAHKGVIGQDRPVLFWHTGGSPALFAHEELFHAEALRLSSPAMS